MPGKCGRRSQRESVGLVLGLLALAAGLRAAGEPPASAPAVSASTREMAALLRQRALLVNPKALSLIVNDRRAEAALQELARPLPPAERMQKRGVAIVELINAGRTEDALKALEALEADARASDPQGAARYRPGGLMLKATAYLRMAEEQNCHQAGSRDACLLPVKGQGIHRNREGSTRATEVLRELLELEPANLRARWLLNIAQMTLGGYPDAVPAAYLIAPATFAPEHTLERFDNMAQEAGLDLYGLSGGAILDDFDGDGRLDLVVSAMGFADQMHFFKNMGAGIFEERTESSGLTGETGGLNLLQADYDNDGFLDVLVLRGGWLGTEGRFPLSLLKGRGDGTFEDVTRAAGLLRLAPTQTATFLDYDGDGWLDLFVGNESGPGDDHPCELYHNNRDGTFSEVAREAGVAYVGFVKGVVSGDYDNDGRPDLYVSVLNADNLLFHNEGPTGPSGAFRFTNVAAQAGVTEPRASFSTFFFDYDNDGWLDLFVAGYGNGHGGLPVVEDVAADYLGLPTSGERGRLFHNRGDGRFDDVTRAAHLYKVVPAMGIGFGDLDNDGWLDFYAGTGTPDLGMLVPNRMFRNEGGRVFQDVTTAGNFGHLQKGHAIAFGDFDNDGDQDVFEQMGGAYFADRARSALYRNPGNANAWLGLELEGVRSNRRAIGARIQVAASGPGGPRVLYRTVGSGGSFGASPLRQEIGLGEAARIDFVRVTWPTTGEVQRIAGLVPGHRYRIREGTPEAREVAWPP